MENLLETYIKKVENAISISYDSVENSVIQRTKLHDQLLTYFYKKSSSIEEKILLNELGDSETTYLQVGGDGGRFLSSMYSNDLKYSIYLDDFGGEFFSFEPLNKIINVASRIGLTYPDDFTLIKDQHENPKQTTKNILNDYKFNLYVQHSYNKKTLIELIKVYAEYLDNISIFVTNVIDNDVATNIKETLSSCNLTVKKEWLLNSDYDAEKKLYWGNSGLYVAILEK